MPADKVEPGSEQRLKADFEDLGCLLINMLERESHAPVLQEPQRHDEHAVGFVSRCMGQEVGELSNVQALPSYT